MKKRLLAILVLLVLAVFALTSCNLFFTPEKPTYKVTFDTDGGSAVETQVITRKEPVIKPEEPTKEGHTFAGWFADEDFTEAWDFEGNLILEATTIYAKWTLNSHTVDFVGSEDESQTVGWNTTATKPADPTKVGHTFGGWFADEGFQTAFDFTKPIKGDTTVYAKWNINSYTVSFDVEGVASQTVQFGSLATKPTDPTKAGHTFRGWLLGGVAFDFTTPITESISLSANWEINKYTITYTDGVDGETVFEDKVFENVEYGEDTPTIAEPIRQGYQFNGWDIDVADTVSGDVTYTATWVLVHEHSYTVKNTSAKYLKTEATCTEPAVYYYSCSQCIAKGSETFQHGAPLGHDMGAWTETKAPTCTETGSEKRDCSRCDHSETRDVTAKGHSYSSVVTAPTCTEDGYTTHTCGTCGHSYTDTPVGKLGHNMGQWTQTKAPTCTDKGTERRNCTRCSHFETRDVEALNHSFTTYVYNNDATCTEDGTETAKCDRCDETHTRTKSGTAGHKYGQLVAGTDATCTSTGTISHYQCSGCGKYFNENKEQVDSITIPKNSQHTSTEFVYVNNNDGTHSKTHKCCGAVIETTDCSDVTTDNNHNCDICGQENVSEHTDGNDNDHLCDNGCGQVADNGCHGGTATCVAKAVCEECGQEYGDIDLANHIWEEGKLLCTRDCGYEKVEVWKLVTDVSKLENNSQIIIVAAGYSYALGSDAGNYRNRVEIIKNDDGTVTINDDVQIITVIETAKGYYLCVGTNQYLYAPGSSNQLKTQSNTNDKSTWTIGISSEGVATIKAIVGEKNWLQYNADSSGLRFSCYSTTQKSVSIYMLTEEVKLHEHTVVVDNAVKPGCESTGLTEGSHCKTCGEVLVAQEEIPANGHSKSPVKTDAKAPACESTGTKAYWQCTECEGYFSDEACTKEIENLAAWLQTEGENGGLVAATGHTEVIDKAVAATCTSKGLTEGKHCDVCKKVLVEQEETSVLSHVDTNPKDNKCDVCGNTICVHEGGTANCQKGAVCTKCGLEYTSKDATNHVNTTEHQQVNATCTEVGYTAGTYCEDCDKWISGHAEIEAIAHKNKVHHAESPATCNATGTIEYWSCPDCGKNFSDEACTTEATDLTIAIDSANHVNTTAHEQTNATCTEVGYTAGTYCEDCNTWVSGHEEIKALGHKDEDGNYACDNGCGKYIVVTSVTIADYADANGWANETQYKTVIIDNVITVTAEGGGNTGKYYVNGENWRMYQTESATVSITSNDCKIISVKITYSSEKTGVLILNEKQIASNTTVTVNGTSITFGVGNSKNDVTKGQARITAIEVSYVVDEMPTNTVTINYVDEKGNKIGESKTIEVATGSNFDFNDNITSIDNYTFQKWLNFEDEEIDGSIKINSDITVTAVYNHNHSFTNYESDGNATCTEDGTKTATCDIDGCNVTDTVTDIDSKLGHEDENKDHACDNGCNVYQGEHKDTNADHKCDYGCNVAIGTCEDKDFDHDCDYGCDKYFGTHADSNTDHKCDYGCNETIGTCEDTDKDHKCDYGCDKTFGTCEDKDLDHDCDYGCGKDFGTHADGDDNNHLCDYGCGQVADDGCHDVETDDDHNCDECGEPCGEHSYTNEIVDAKYLKSAANCTSTAVYYKSCNCGEYEEDVNNTFTYGGVNAENHASALEHTEAKAATCSAEGNVEYWSCSSCGFNYSDEAGTSKLDSVVVEINANAHNYGEWTNDGNKTSHSRVCSYNNDHKETENCSGGTATCQTAATCTKCGEQYGDVDPNGHYDGDDENNNCDGCEASLCETHTEDEGTITTQPGCETTGTRTYKCTACGVITRTETVAKTGHKDENKDHACDNGCNVYQGEHVDAGKDHVCDYGCKEAIGTCEDKDFDHDCDYGCSKVYGDHKDNDKNHTCDYGCNVAIGTCEDADKDHDCDYGCGKDFGTHADSADDDDHVCDYGCGATLEDCVDKANDGDHKCDVCDKADVTEHTYSDATCETAKTCTECGATTGEALGHTYGEASYTWTGVESCTATRVCANDANHTETANATITSAVKTPATCTVMGTTTYTATFTVDWATTQTKDVQDITEIPHTYNQKNTADAYKASSATCTAKATYYYSCSCGVASTTETFEYGTVNATNHATTLTHTEAKAATCSAAGNVEYWSCSSCGCNYSDEAGTNKLGSVVVEINVNAHNYGGWTNDGNGTSHSRVCSYNNDHKETENCVPGENSHNCKGCGTTISGHRNVDGDNACDICGKDIKTTTTATLTFDANKSNRTEFSTTKQVWVQNGVTFTNNKASSQNNVADYGNPVRLYKGSEIVIEYAGMTQIVFTCDTNEYVTNLKNSISDASVTVDGMTVIVTFEEAVDSFTITLTGGQVRMNSLSVSAITTLELPTYEVIFKNEDGNVLKEMTVVEGTTISYTGATPTKDSTEEFEYTFAGWDKDFGKATENVTYTATYTSTPRYKVTFNVNGGTPELPYQIVTSGKTASNPDNISKDGCSFAGWYTDSNCTDGNEWSFATIITSNVDLYAKWEQLPDESVTVTFVVDGNTYDTQTVTSGSAVTAPVTNPTKSGYNFIGWYDENGTEWKSGTVVTTNLTLTAQWEKEPVTETLTIKGTTGTLASDKLSISWTGDEITLTNNKSSSSTAIRNSDSAHYRAYVGSEIVIAGNSDQKITEIVITCSSTSYMGLSVSSDNYSISTSGTKITISLNDGFESLDEVILEVTKQTRITSVKITYTN